jgi:hypothetical protein
MAITRVQATPVGSGSGVVASATATFTFPVTPTAGNFIVVLFAVAGGDQTPITVTVTDNQGNTYHSAGAPVPTNGVDSYIYYAWNVAASGTFTITAHKTVGSGAGALEIRGCAVEWSGIGLVDPIVGFGSSGSSSCTTLPTGSAEVLVCAVYSAIRLNFNITAITVGAKTPAFLQEWERLSNTPFALVGEADTRVSTDNAAESASWSVSTNPSGPNSMIAAFAAAPPGATMHLSQFSREVFELDGTVGVNLSQYAREVFYPFACTPSGVPIPTPPPTPQPGCPEAFEASPIAPGDGCDGQVTTPSV